MNENTNQFILLGDVIERVSDDLLAFLQVQEATPMLFSVAAASAETFSLHVPSYAAGLEVGQRLKALRGGGQ